MRVAVIRLALAAAATAGAIGACVGRDPVGATDDRDAEGVSEGGATDGGVAPETSPNVDDASAFENRYAEAVAEDKPKAHLRLGEDGGSAARDEYNQFPGTYSPSVRFGRPGALAGDPDTAVDLDGVAGCIDLGDVAGLGFTARKTFTLEAWIKPHTAPDGGFAFVLGKLEINAGGNSGYSLRLTTDLKLQFDRNDGEKQLATKSLRVVGSQIFSHVAVTYSGVIAAFFINGAPAGSQSLEIDVAPTPSHFSVGCNPSTALRRFDGVIDEIAIYDKALSPDAIKRHYDAAQPKP
jgi:concanavalin A-like lectin/glucanase superfamily protein